MSNKIIFTFIMLGVFSCSQPEVNTDEMPTDLSALQSLKKETSQQIRELEDKLDLINEKISEINPTILKSAVLVTVDSVAKKDFQHYVTIQSSVQSDEVAKISPEMGGRITSIAVKEGQRVRKGQLLAKVDVSQMEKQLAELETSLSLARDVFERQKRLWDQNIGSEIQYLEAKNQVDRLEKSKETIQNQMSKGHMYAPISGVVEKVLNEVGEIAGPGFPVVQIIDVNDLKVVADLPENYLQAVRRGDKVEIHFPALDKDIRGKVSLVGQTIDPSNRTFKVEVDIPNSGGLLKPNLLAEMKINDYTIDDVIVVSADLVQQEVGGKNFIYIAEKKDDQIIAQKRYVKLGESGDNQIVITEGLEPNDIILVDGAFNVTSGDVIEIKSEQISE